MNQKCYLCKNDRSNIIERPNGYDGNHVSCPQCTNYKITRNAKKKIMQGYKVPASLRAVSETMTRFNDSLHSMGWSD